jgi:hypothetical protein
MTPVGLPRLGRRMPLGVDSHSNAWEAKLPRQVDELHRVAEVAFRQRLGRRQRRVPVQGKQVVYPSPR